jgi:hypothetical protein
MKRAVWVADLALLFSGVSAFAIFLSAGGLIEWHGHLIRAERARNPLWFFFGVALVRFHFAGDAPFLGRWRVQSAAARFCDRLREGLRGLDPARAGTALTVLLSISAALKLWNVARHYGFAFGDDVEIHVMTFSALRHADWGVWNLRSPVYPLTFIYPIQYALITLGLDDPGTLIAAGRLFIVAMSLLNVWLAYRLGVRLFDSPAVGLLAAGLLATARLAVRLGSTELPGTLSGTLLLVALSLLVARPRFGRVALAGVALGFAAALRFSEAVFALPAALHLGLERRYRDLAVVGGVAGLTAAVVLGPGDRLFWPEMFHSLRHIVDFTIVRGESSRGFEPLWHYLQSAPWWSDPFTLFFFACGWRSAPRPLRFWAVAPVAALSAFPHKEERYLLPALSFVLLIAACGAWRAIDGTAVAAPRRKMLVALALLGALALEIEGFRFRRSEAAVDVARFLAVRDDVRSVAMEDATTTTGAVLYLRPRATVVNIDGRELQEPTFLQTLLARPDTQYVVLQAKNATEERRTQLELAGFREIDAAGAPARESYAIFRRQTNGSRSGFE